MNSAIRKSSRFFVALISLLALAPFARADAPATRPTVSLLAMGDWGDGGDAQKKVANELADVASKQKVPINAMLLAGDNFYVPVTSVNDPVWTNLFEKMYDPKKLPMPFYPSLGNHDYEGDKSQIERDYSKTHPDSRWKMPAKWYREDFPAGHPVVSLLVLDSNKDF